MGDAENTWWDADDMEIDDLRSGGTEVVALDTLAGPIFVGSGVAAGGGKKKPTGRGAADRRVPQASPASGVR
jgi:hypothetical protein